MNIAYFGSPLISKQLLDNLLDEELHISLIVTQPDKSAGKRLEMTPTAVKKAALKHTIDLFDLPLRKNEDKLITILHEKKIELGILFAYGEILSTSLLASMKHGIWNVHPSLLPKHRGPAPIIYPLIMGDVETGTTLMQMSKGLDEGDIIEQTSIPITLSDDRDKIEQKLIHIAGKQILNALSLLKKDSLQSKQQNHQCATYTKLLKKGDGFLSPTFISQALKSKNIAFAELPAIIQQYYIKNNIEPAENYQAGLVLYNLYKGLHPWPGVWTKVRIDKSEKRLKVLDVKLVNQTPKIDTVQLEGKKAVDFKTFQKAYNIFE